MPCGERKSGIPQFVEMPAPVRTTILRDVRRREMRSAGVVTFSRGMRFRRLLITHQSRFWRVWMVGSDARARDCDLKEAEEVDAVVRVSFLKARLFHTRISLPLRREERASTAYCDDPEDEEQLRQRYALVDYVFLDELEHAC